MTHRGTTHRTRTVSIAPELVAKLRKMIARDGLLRTAATLRSSTTLLEKIISHGFIQPVTAARLAPQIERMT